MACKEKIALNIKGIIIHPNLHVFLISLTQTIPSANKLETISTHYENFQIVVFDDEFQMADAFPHSIKKIHNNPFGKANFLGVWVCSGMFYV